MTLTVKIDRKETIKRILPNRKYAVTVLTALVFYFLTGCGERASENKQEASSTYVPDSVYIKEGNRITALTFDTLRQSLLKAIALYGMEGAIGFCHEKAYPITGAYADTVAVRRTSLRYRNPENKPDSLEQSVLTRMEDQLKISKKPEAMLVRNSSVEEIHFFKPIILQAMCLNCHGAPGKEVQEQTLAKIHQVYPSDEAVNFKEGDLRGVWHIVFKPQKK